MPVFFILFVVVPLLELFVLIKVGSAIGALMTVALLILGGVLGVFLMRMAGISTVLNARSMIERGQLADTKMLNSVLLALSGLLFFLPGFLSDIAALVLLLGPARRAMGSVLVARFKPPMRDGAFEAADVTPRETARQPRVRSTQPETIDGEWERRD